mmetsp:Transcript_10785/g.13522  ORF Transcript_10785/g.13522 Transcript_10785/m.13522 type:complete len:120 (+) Transcript_10785:496-855(+)
MNFLHNDIKQENMVVGHHDSDQLYLIDFGLSLSYLKEDGTHIAKRKSSYFSGNFLYASINVCRGMTKARRDDIQSAFYILVSLLNGGKLPWSDFNKRPEFANMNFAQLVRERLRKTYTQ